MSETESLIQHTLHNDNYGSATQPKSPDMEEKAREHQEAETEMKNLPGVDSPMKKSRKRLYLARTFFLYFAYICLGLQIAEGGVTFLDLLLLFRTDIEHGSIYYTAASIGYASGALLAGILYDLLNWDGLLFLALFGMGSLNVGLVYSPVLWLMALLNGLKGATLGSLDTGGNTVCLGMWKDEGSPYLQALHLSFSVGGVIAPFIAEPFLAPKSNATSENSTTGMANHMANNSSYRGVDFLGNASVIPHVNLTVADVPTTQVEYVFVIIGGVTVLASFPFLALFLSSLFKRKSASAVTKTDDVTKEQSSAKEMSLKLKIIMLILLGVFYASYVSLEAFIEGYLMTFVVNYLEWSKTEGTRITSVFWGTFAGGRLLGILTSKFLSPWRMLLVDLVLVNAVFVPLWFVTKQRGLIMWICIPLSGVFMATIFPCGISWTNEKITRVSGKVASVFVLSSTVGGIVNPMLLGYLFKHVSPMWFIYLLITYSISCIVIFVILTTILGLTGRKSHKLSTAGDIQR